jgi:hypothetical protein
MSKMTKRAEGDHYSIFPSTAGNREKYYWRVTKDKNGFGGVALAYGYCSDFDNAFRAARNFMKNNQELVYGSNSQPARILRERLW